jgi:hypothetical protein
MGDFGALGSALYTLVDGATTLPVHYALAPQGQPQPYVIVQRQDGRDEHTFTSKGLTADYVVKVVAKDQWPTAAQRTYDAIHNQIEGGGTVAVSGYNLLRFERQTTIEYQDPGQFWHVGGLYRVEVWEE